MWKNGGTGLLRTNFRNKVASASSAQQPATSSTASSSRSSPMLGVPGRITSAPTGRTDDQVTSSSSAATGRSILDQPRGPVAGTGRQTGPPPPAGFYGLSPEAVRIASPISTPPPLARRAEVMSIHDQVAKMG